MHRSHRFETRRASIPSPHRPTWRRLYAPLLLAALPGCLSDACSHFAEDFVGGLACQASADIGNSRLQDVVDDALTMERRALGPVQFAIVVDRGRALTKHDPLPDDANGCARMREQQGGRALYDLSACARFQGLLLVDDGSVEIVDPHTGWDDGRATDDGGFWVAVHAVPSHAPTAARAALRTPRGERLGTDEGTLAAVVHLAAVPRRRGDRVVGRVRLTPTGPLAGAPRELRFDTFVRDVVPASLLR